MTENSKYVVKEIDPLSSPEHYVEIVRLHKECFPEDDMYLPEKGCWWVIYSFMKPVAFAGMVPIKGDDTSYYMCRAGVTRKHRGNGLQQRLIRVRIQKARQLGLTRLVTSTYCNPISSNNLIKAGFRMFTPVKGWGAIGTNYWTKGIAPCQR